MDVRDRYLRQRLFGHSARRIRMIAVGRADHEMLRFLGNDDEEES